MASAIYGEKITDPKDPRRQAGKVAELQLGFGSGRLKFQATAKRWGVELDDGKARFAVSEYRRTHDKVVNLWREADDIIRELTGGWGHWRIFEVRNHRIYHPDGSWLDYSGLKWEEGEWRLYDRRGQWSKMYGAKLVENIVQWLSRIIAKEAMVRFANEGYLVVGMAHDDVWLLIRENRLDHIEDIEAIMSRTPEWAPRLPLAADCKIGKTYGG